MTEKRWLYFALGVTTVISLGAVTNQLVPLASAGLMLDDSGITFPDGTVQTTASTGDSRPGFYLTAGAATGVVADEACAEGFHRATYLSHRPRI